MNDKVFLDTNIIIYLYSEDEPEKKANSLQIVQSHSCLISTQVLNEIINVLNRKFHLPYSDIRIIINELTKHFPISNLTTDTISQAIDIAERYQYSYFDSLVISSALQTECIYLYSEDLQHRYVIQSQLTIINPFV